NAKDAGQLLSSHAFAAAYCSDTTRAQQTAQIILEMNKTARNQIPELISDMHFREQCYGYFEGRDMTESWWAVGAPHGAKSYNEIVEKFGLAATRDFMHEADPFHDAESDEQYWKRVEDGFTIIANNSQLHDGDEVLQISHGNTLLSLMHKFGGNDLDLSERPANGSVTQILFDTEQPFSQALTVVDYNRQLEC
ncbi:MAG: histidine phosphatase family protein, partial [Bifidobacteriaceae bacterium]|nr:histidine phosphatase family protein [Bifidobacteriaceae bacterium]